MLPAITVVNQRKTTEGEYIGRPSPLGNPFGWQEDHPDATRVSNREEAIACYREWLMSHIRTRTPRIVNELERLGAIALRDGRLTLRCWCSPKPCHGDVLRKILLEAIQDSLST